MDWVTTQSFPPHELKKALEIGNPGKVIGHEHPLLRCPRSHLELVVYYVGSADGTLIKTLALHYLPTSRGTITLASKDPADSPVMDPNHLDTEADRYRHRVLMRMTSNLMSTPAGREMVVEEAVPEGSKAVTTDSTNEEVDVRVR